MLRLSKGERCSGIIKNSADDFIVEEIAQNGTILKLDTIYSPESLGFVEDPDGKFSFFILQKSNWNTTQALKVVANKLGRGIKSVGFAGTKDRISKSTQLCSIFGADPEAVKHVHVKDIQINGAWKYNRKIEMGDLAGNRFTINVKNPEKPENISDIVKELNGKFPNYFGSQRFGSRNNNFDVGLNILKGDFKGAVMVFLTDTRTEENEQAIEARKSLAEREDFSSALNYFPTYLKYERSVIEYLSRFENNYANAIRRLPRSISLMFTHSVEDKIFNTELEEMIKNDHITPQNGDLVCHSDPSRFYDLSKSHIYESKNNEDSYIAGNILGYETKTITEFEKNELEKLGLTLESFKCKGLQELNCKGSQRVMFAPYKEFSYELKDDLKLSFSLPAGSYATIFLNEIIEFTQAKAISR